MDLAGHRRTDRGREVVGLGVLEQEAARAGLDRGGDAVLVDEAREGDDLDRGVPGLDLGRGGDPVHLGHQQVHDHDVRCQFGGRRQRRQPVGRLADDLEVVVERQEVAHAATDHRVVVDEQDPDPIGHRSMVHRARAGPVHRRMACLRPRTRPR